MHFRDEDIERDFVTKLKDGTIHRIPRKKPLLKPHAVPVFFPNISIPLLKSQQISYGWKDLLLECNGSENQKYHIIKKHCDLVPLPSKLWTVYNCAKNFIAWIGICEDEAHTTMRVILLPDMRVQVSFLDFIIFISYILLTYENTTKNNIYRLKLAKRKCKFHVKQFLMWTKFRSYLK